MTALQSQAVGAVGRPVSAAAVRETHVGVVFLFGDRAYKVKKPVVTDFLDFRTPQRRAVACAREVELNRRLAPDVYLGVAEVSDVDGQVCDHLVVMRRMPADRRLATLAAGQRPLDAEITAIARAVAGFHVRAAQGPQIDAEGTRDALQARWRANIDEVRSRSDSPVGQADLGEIERLADEFLAGRQQLFARRIAEHHIVDGHGDLIADDVFCLADGPRILDCLEFDDRLRYLDGLDDICFLAMDLERLDRPELAELLLRQYRRFAADPAPPALRHHYIAYRAFVRAKVAGLRHIQGDQDAAALARQYTELTLRHLRSGRVRLVLVGGLPGTGKTTVAGTLADRLGAVLISSDRVRKELAGQDPSTPATAEYQSGLYQPEHTDRVYRELVRRAGQLLGHGETVVLDASWLAAEHREQAAACAADIHAPLVELRCAAPEEVAAERIRARTGSASDATPTIAARMATDVTPWPTAIDVPTSTTQPDLTAVWPLLLP